MGKAPRASGDPRKVAGQKRGVKKEASDSKERRNLERRADKFEQSDSAAIGAGKVKVKQD